MFSIFKKKPFFTPEEQSAIVAAIRKAEQRTSGEVRVYAESKNPWVDPMERASEIFFNLKMQETDHRNAVLVYLATKHHEVALFADEGIYQAVGQQYWNERVKIMLSEFDGDNISAGVIHCIECIGEALHEKFPYIPTEDKNELPDEIIFGK